MSRITEVIGSAQKGLLHNPTYGVFVTVVLKREANDDAGPVLAACRTLHDGALDAPGKARAIVAFSPALWSHWSGTRPRGAPPGDSVISSSAKLRDSGADLWLYLKADDAEGAEHLKRGAEDELGELAEELSWTEARRRHHGLILDGRFYDGITSPMDPVTLVDAILQNRDGAALGSCWAFSQKVELDWASYGSLGKVARDDVIGRNEDGVIIPDHEVRSHIRHARAYDETRSNLKLLRQSLPYGESETGAGREQGIYFAAFGQDSGSVETILRRMTGGDSLLGYVRGVEGGYWYVPNAEELGIDEPMQLEDVEIDPYWQERSANGLMFYNSADYLHTMGTCAYGPGDPPTDRVLGLAADIFSRWRDNWYQLRDIPRIPHLREFLDPGEESLLQAGGGAQGAGDQEFPEPRAHQPGLAPAPGRLGLPGGLFPHPPGRPPG